jgi:hypothetical protein
MDLIDVHVIFFIINKGISSNQKGESLMASKNGVDPKKPQDNETSKSSDNRGFLNKIAKSLLSSVDDNYDETIALRSRNTRFQNIINRELNLAKGIAKGDIVDFVASSARNDYTPAKEKANSADSIDFEKMLQTNAGDLSSYFQDIYKNKYVEMQDLKFISKFIPALGEAVKTTLDNIVTSDDMSNIISRTLKIGGGVSDGKEDTEQQQIILAINKIEKDLGLLKKLKNVVYKNALITGNYYVYAVSYSKLFKKFNDDMKAKASAIKTDGPFISPEGKAKANAKQNATAKANNQPVPKSAVSSLESLIDMSPALEGLVGDTDQKESGDVKKFIDNFTKNELSSVYTLESSIPYPTLLELNSSSDMVLESLQKKFTDNKEKQDEIQKNFSDGTYGSDEAGKNEFDIPGTYIKCIDSKNIIPVRILNETVGYYHIFAEKKKTTNTSSGETILGPTGGVFSSISISEKKKDDLIEKITDRVANQIVNSFSKRYVEDNVNFKKMIADCLIYNGLSNNDYKIQFIPADDIIEFPVNPNSDNIGESILSDSLFPAKLLLSLLICKILTYMNKSGNKTIAYIHKGTVDTGTSNQVMRVIRNLQESNITFTDLLSPNVTFSKLTRDSNIAMPTSKSEKRLIEFETLEGQNIELNTDFENKLERMAIMGTGVPSVIFDSMDQVDFAKSITSANIKFAGRIASLQGDFEGPTTRLYLKLIRDSDLPEYLKRRCEQYFEFKLPRPKVLSNTNSSEHLSTLQSMVNVVCDTMYGQNTTPTPRDIKSRNIFSKKLVIQNSQYLDWGAIQKAYDDSEMEASEDDKNNEDQDNQQ